MAQFHDKLVLSKYMLSLLGIESLGKTILDGKGNSIYTELKDSNNEGYTADGNTHFLQCLLNDKHLIPLLTSNKLQEYDQNIVRHNKEISEDRENIIVWKYFQYLSLLFTEIYLDRYFENKTKFVAELNEYLKLYNSQQAEINKKNKNYFEIKPFGLNDLNKLAYWNATGSGKTLLMHINIKQYLYYAKKYNIEHQNKIILITPNEGLSKQHLDEFKQSNIPANIFKKNTPSLYTSKEVEILEITKLADSGGDKAVAVDSFETDNLVLIDEGHGGMGGDSWKKYRDQLSATGFAFEYSATFGQAINAISKKQTKEEFTQEYGKSILFDYSYKFFYGDGYGKDYRILNLKDDTSNYQRLYLTANLLSFFQQLLIFSANDKLACDFNIHKPLWVFVGGKVNAVRSENKKEVSDVLEIIYFISDFLKNGKQTKDDIQLILEDKAGLIDSAGYPIFYGAFNYLKKQSLSVDEIFAKINELVFNNTTIGANVYLDNLKGAYGELGLRVGNSERYFGVINVGDEKKLFDLAINNDVLGSEKDFSDSLFKTINNDDSTINLLIGSKKFTEGWSSWRVSSMGLMNVGKSEGSQIIQLFGRGVRLKGYNFSLKRSTELDSYQQPTNLASIRKILNPLETLYIFGVQANYMEQFKIFLEEEGLPTNDSAWKNIQIPVVIKKKILKDNGLKVLSIKKTNTFKQKPISLKLEEQIFLSRLVELDRYPTIEAIDKNSSKVSISKNETILTNQHLVFLDWDKIYLELLAYKKDKSYNNLIISKSDLEIILKNSTWYTLYIPEKDIRHSSYSQFRLWEELSIALLKKYIDKYYLYYKNEFLSNQVETIVLTSDNDNFISEYNIQLNTLEDIDLYEEKLEQLKTELYEEAFEKIGINSGFEAFDNKLHLYKPLIYIDSEANKKAYSNFLQVSPVALDQFEKMFLDDLISYMKNNEDYLIDKEVYILRNQSKKGFGFFAGGNNFYPDFILWIIKGEYQYIKFIDPKGIRNSKGLNDPKIQFHSVLKDRIQSQVEKDNIFLDSYIISNTRFKDINWAKGIDRLEFNNNNVLFQLEQKNEYIGQILKTD
ncbi:DEAD/DEAH box helicase family protein [Dysgonomonas sp. GY617]|uniref:DEAD/DEAH box helicase family protein n=1 Tax=Dysgonomonas sp. GY617 TaxID=2780420 RepID=UPI0018832081|nr:DEAD/DEAH box helicase family protein [Dysgonomonas sp. GY617]MBF0576260.1 DEAD/DEAH box helicase family protein [Dysgonomonas sp. GY617]